MSRQQMMPAFYFTSGRNLFRLCTCISLRSSRDETWGQQTFLSPASHRGAPRPARSCSVSNDTSKLLLSSEQADSLTTWTVWGWRWLLHVGGSTDPSRAAGWLHGGTHFHFCCVWVREQDNGFCESELLLLSQFERLVFIFIWFKPKIRIPASGLRHGQTPPYLISRSFIFQTI